MEHLLEGPCCVCGATTTHRCSPCAENGFDLFLCGREHQKLVWYAHKKVCGVNSKPFHIPSLSPEEVAFAHKIAYKPIVMTRKEPTTLVETLSTILADAPPDRVMMGIACSHFNVGKDLQHVNHGIICTTSAFITEHRAAIIQASQAGPVRSKQEAKRWIEQADPLLLVRSFADMYANRRESPRESFEASYPVTDPYYIEVMHLAVVYSAIRQKWERLKLQHIYRTSSVPHSHFELVVYMKQVATRMREVLGRLRLRDEADAVALEKAIWWIVSHREQHGL